MPTLRVLHARSLARKGWLFAILLLGSAPVALSLQGSPIASLSASETKTSKPGVLADRATLLRRYQEQLNLVRAGQAQAESALEATAQQLALAGRMDAAEVAHFYLDMSPGERAAGLQAEQRFLDIRERVQAAGSGSESGLGNAGEWPAKRERLLAELSALIAEQLGAADCTPAARCHALLSRLHVARLDRDGSLSRNERRILLDEASQHAGQARDGFARAKQRTPQLEPLWLQAELARLDGNPKVARGAYRELLDLAELTDRSEYQVQALRGLVCLARESGDMLGLQAHLQDWNRLQDPRKSWPLAMEQTLWLLSQDQARSALNTLWACQPEVQDQGLQWQALLASALRRRGHLPAARRALERMQSQFPEEWEMLTLAHAHQEQAEGNPELAAQQLEESYPFETWSPRGRVQALALLGHCLLQQEQPALALPHLMHALDGAHRWEARRLGPGSVGGEWLGLHAIVLAAQAAADSGDLLLAATILESNQGRNWKRGLDRDPDAGLAEHLMQLREEGAGLLLFGFGADHAIALHLGPEGREAYATIDLTRSQWRTALRRLNDAARQGDELRTRSLAREISSALFPQSLRASLEPGTGQTLRILAHGPLQTMPMALLDWKALPLREAFQVIVLPGLLPHSPTPPEPTRWQDLDWSLLGAPTPSQYAPLAHAAAELQQLAKGQRTLGHTADLCTGAALTAEAMRTRLTSGHALHIATHLVSATDCDPSGYSSQGMLLAHDAVFCAGQVAALRPNSPLVYLGTCSSGTGNYLDGEGTLGVARAFLEGGTRNLVVTLWPVADGPAADFALYFHAGLQAGKRPSQAVEAARERMRQDGLAPVDWAAFQHLGWD